MVARPDDPRWPRASGWLTGPAPDAAARWRLGIIGIPTWRSSLSATGAHATPAAVRSALHRLSTWAPSAGLDLSEMVAVLDAGDVPEPDEPATGQLRASQAVRELAGKAHLVVSIGGDNSLTVPAVLGLSADLGRCGLVTLDAHHDLREGHSNGSPVRELLDAGLSGGAVVQVGIADWANSQFYSVEAGRRGITVITTGEVRRRGMADCMTEALSRASALGGPVHVDLDVDVCDRSVAPGCPASLPGGLAAAELLAAARAAGAHPAVRGVDIAEVDSSADPDGRTVRLAAMAVLEIALGLAQRGSPGP